MQWTVTDPRAQCVGKHAYSGGLAFKVARRKRGLSAYHCPHCGRWHVGHVDKSASAKPKMRAL